MCIKIKVSRILFILLRKYSKDVPSFLKVVKGVAAAVGEVAGAIGVLAGGGGNATTVGGGVGAAAGFPVWASLTIAIGLLLLVVGLVVGLCVWQQAIQDRCYR